MKSKGKPCDFSWFLRDTCLLFVYWEGVDFNTFSCIRHQLNSVLLWFWRPLSLLFSLLCFISVANASRWCQEEWMMQDVKSCEMFDMMMDAFERVHMEWREEKAWCSSYTTTGSYSLSQKRQKARKERQRRRFPLIPSLAVREKWFVVKERGKERRVREKNMQQTGMRERRRRRRGERNDDLVADNRLKQGNKALSDSVVLFPFVILCSPSITFCLERNVWDEVWVEKSCQSVQTACPSLSLFRFYAQ